MNNNKKTASDDTGLADRKFMMFILISCAGLFLISIILPPIFTELNDKTVTVSVIQTETTTETALDTAHENAGNTNAKESTVTAKAAGFPLDVNSATADELTAIDGIGSVTAGNIVDYRTAKGCFYSLDELLNVDGIGSKKLENLKKYLYVDTASLPETTALTEYSNESDAPLSETEYSPDFPLELNSATAEELTRIKGIGTATAEKIVGYAKAVGFTSVDDLINVKGIGIAKLESIRPYVYVASENTEMKKAS